MSKSYKLFIAVCLLLTVAGLGLIALEGTLQIKEKADWNDVVSAIIHRLQYGKSLGQSSSGNSSAVVDHSNVNQQPLITERVNLPDVEGHFWLTFLYQDNWQTDAETVRLNNMFHSDPRLVAMRKRCRVNSFSQMDPYMTDRWQKYVGSNTPMVVLQSPEGRLCFKASRGNLPTNSDEMVAQIQQSLDQCFRRPCPNPSPAPTPQPNPSPVAPVNPLPDTIGPAEEPQTAGEPLWLLPVLGIAGASGSPVGSAAYVLLERGAQRAAVRTSGTNTLITVLMRFYIRASTLALAKQLAGEIHRRFDRQDFQTDASRVLDMKRINYQQTPRREGAWQIVLEYLTRAEES